MPGPEFFAGCLGLALLSLPLLVPGDATAEATPQLDDMPQHFEPPQIDTPAAVPIRIALISDTHTNRGTADQALYQRRFDVTIAAVNAAGVDLILIAGDLTHNGHAEEMADFQAQLKKLQAPLWCVPGNHDVGNKISLDKVSLDDTHNVTAERVALYETVFGPSYFLIEQAGVRVVGLNASILGSDLSCAAAQWDFLEKALSQPAVLPTLVLMHYPLFLTTPDEPSDPYWNVEPAPRARLLGLLQQGGVRAVLSGHIHRPLINHLNGIVLVSSPPVAFGLPIGEQPQGWTLVTLSPQGRMDIQVQYIDG